MRSRKNENLQAAVGLYFAYHNLCRVHASLRITPAVQAGITDHMGRWRNWFPSRVSDQPSNNVVASDVRGMEL